MDKPAAQLVQSGPIAEARAAQGELDQAAKEDPAKVLARQKDALGKAEDDMAGAADAGARGAHRVAPRHRQGRDRRRQQGMVGSEEPMRAKAGAEAQAVFNEAQSAVKALLKPLASNAMDEWEAAKTVARHPVQDRPQDRQGPRRRAPFGRRRLGSSASGTRSPACPAGRPRPTTRPRSNFADGVIAQADGRSRSRSNTVIAACERSSSTARASASPRSSASCRPRCGAGRREEQEKFDGQLDKLAQRGDRGARQLQQGPHRALEPGGRRGAGRDRRAAQEGGRSHRPDRQRHQPLPRRSGQVHHRGAARAPRHPAGGVLGGRRQDQEGRQRHRRRPDGASPTT